VSKEIPAIEFRDIDPLQDYYFDCNGDSYSVARLVDEAKRLKPFDLPLAALDLSDRIWEGCSIYGLAFHCKKVEEASLDYPIILDWNGAIADGRHRIIRAIIDGKKTIKAVRITWKMTPCRVSED
jgi:hypothetical protein